MARSTPHRVLWIDRALTVAAGAQGLFEGDQLIASGPPCDYASVISALRTQIPDLVIVDLSLPIADGLRAVEEVMAELPVPIVALYTRHEPVAEVAHALARGALEVIERPTTPPIDFWRTLARRIAPLATVHVAPGRRPRSPRSTHPPAEVHAPFFDEVSTVAAPFPLVAIAASLGGPKALATLLAGLPASFGAPVVICQHLGDGFSAGLAHWLGGVTRMRVEEARHGAVLEPGTVYVATSGSHTRVDVRWRVHLDPGPPIDGFRPSCSALLTSAGRAFGPRAIGVVLTGMGRDGASGLKAIHDRGGHTVAQDEASCVVFGMSHEAIVLGAAERVLPLEHIAAALVEWVGT